MALGRSAWRNFVRRSGGGEKPFLVPLRDGGTRNDPLVARAFDRVSCNHPGVAAELSSLYLQAQCLLLPAASWLCMQNIEQDLITALRVADEGSDQTREGLGDVLTGRVAATRLYLAEHAETRAIRQYVHGLMKAVVYSTALLLLIGFVGRGLLSIIYRSVSEELALALYQTLVGIAGGAAGAVVSVLARSHTNIAYADDSSLVRAAMIRVALGWFFAAAVIFLIKGGVLEIVKVPATDNIVTLWFFWGAVGFLAGFNERWVRQLIARGPADEGQATPKG